MPLYKGRSVDAIRLRWGPPEQAIKVEGGTIYTWREAQNYTFAGTTTSTGLVGNTPVMISSPTTETATLTCRAEVHADSAGMIMGWKFRGANGACDRMMKQLL